MKQIKERTMTIDKFKDELRDFMYKHVVYESIEYASKACLDDNGPLAAICNKYFKNGIICKAKRICEPFKVDQIEHFKVYIGYKVLPNDEYTMIEMTI